MERTCSDEGGSRAVIVHPASEGMTVWIALYTSSTYSSIHFIRTGALTPNLHWNPLEAWKRRRRGGEAAGALFAVCCGRRSCLLSRQLCLPRCARRACMPQRNEGDAVYSGWCTLHPYPYCC